jgi:hypothetical protein
MQEKPIKTVGDLVARLLTFNQALPVSVLGRTEQNLPVTIVGDQVDHLSEDTADSPSRVVIGNEDYVFGPQREESALADLVRTMRYNQKEYFRNARQYGSGSPQATNWLSDSKASEKKVDDYLSGKGEQTTLFQ